MKKEDELIDKIVFKKYKILKKIGKGSFGHVYLCQNISTKENYAVKFEPKNQQDLILERETYLLYYLRGFGIPEIITYGQNSKYNILVQTLLGKSINNLFINKNKKFSLKDCCMIGIQILDRLEYIHSKYIIHRDVKPDNFLIGNPDINTIYLIDFGLAKKYMSTRTGKHAKFTINKKWSGTSRFASANSLRGVAQSRRDDLESLCYLLLFLMKGSLPWDNVYGINENEEILLIYKIKKYMAPELLFMNLPKEAANFFNYCKKLEYEQKPDYNYLRSLLLNILEYSNEKNDFNFSWINKDINDLNSLNSIVEKNKYKIIKRKNSLRKNLYNSLIDNKINFAKRSESYNNIYMNKNNNLENKVKKNCPIIKNISPNLRHVKFNNLFKNEKIQKYKYIKKIPNRKGNIIIQTNNFKKNLELNSCNCINKIENETNNEIKKKINIIPLKNVSKMGNNKSIKNKNNISNNNNIQENKIIFQKYYNNSNEKYESYIIRNNSYNFKKSKNLNLSRYISYNDYINNINNNCNNLSIEDNINNKINKIKNNNSYIKDNKFKRLNFNNSFNNNKFEINSIQTFNNKSYYFKNNDLNSIQRNININPKEINIMSYPSNLKNLNIIKRNNFNDLRKEERINLTNNNIQNNYNINIDINNTNQKNNNSIIKFSKNPNPYKKKKDIKIINILSNINKNSFYHKVKKNFSPKNTQERRNIRIISKKEQDKLDKNKDFNTFIGEGIKNDLFEKYFTNADIMNKYTNLKNKIILNKNEGFYEGSFDEKYKNLIPKRNSIIQKKDLYSYNEIRQNSHNNILKTDNHSLRYQSPKSVEKYKNNF